MYDFTEYTDYELVVSHDAARTEVETWARIYQCATSPRARKLTMRDLHTARTYYNEISMELHRRGMAA